MDIDKPLFPNRKATSPSGVGTAVVNDVNFLQEGMNQGQSVNKDGSAPLFSNPGAVDRPTRSIDDLIGYKPAYQGQNLNDFTAGRDQPSAATVQGTDSQGRLRTFQSEDDMIDNLAQGRASYDAASEARSNGIIFRREQPGGLDLSSPISDRERRGETLSMSDAVDLAGGDRAKARAMIVEGRQPKTQMETLEEDALRLGVQGRQADLDATQRAQAQADFEAEFTAAQNQAKAGTMADLFRAPAGERDFAAAAANLAEQGYTDAADEILGYAPKAQVEKPTPKLGFTTDPETGARIMTYGNTAQNITPKSRDEQQQLTTFQKELNAIDQERTAAGMPALTPQERASALQLYQERKINGAAQGESLADILAAARGDYSPQERSRFQFGQPEGQAPAPPQNAPDPAAAKQSVLDRLGL